MIIQIEPWIDDKELAELKRVIDSTYVTEWKLTEEFETRIKELTGAKYAISMSNGTVALYCALKALGIGSGDEVIVPDLTFIASANAVIMSGAKPVFCDIREDTFCIDIESARQKVTSNTKAVMPVHLYGQSADMVDVLDFSREYNLKVIEDAAQGVGVKYNNKHVGTLGDIGILSFYGNKTITCGEGGIVLTNDDDLARRCYRLKNHGRDNKGEFIHEHIGFNFSFTEMQAAVGIAQLKKLPKIIAKKKKIYDFYVNEFSNLESFRPIFIPNNVKPVYWFTSFLSKDTEQISKFLKEKKIQTRRFFYPLHLQPCYKDSNLIGDFKDSEFPNSKLIYKQGISLPSSYSITLDEQKDVVARIKEFYEHRN